MENESQHGEVLQPFGKFTSRVDDKGRLKMPADLERYLRANLNGKKLVVTSFNGRTARIYLMADWLRAKALLEKPGENAAKAKVLMRRAQHWGHETTIDAEDRVLISPELRRDMGVEKEPVVLMCVDGHIAVEKKEVFEASLQLDQDGDELLEAFEVEGLP